MSEEEGVMGAEENTGTILEMVAEQARAQDGSSYELGRVGKDPWPMAEDIVEVLDSGHFDDIARVELSDEEVGRGEWT